MRLDKAFRSKLSLLMALKRICTCLEFVCYFCATQESGKNDGILVPIPLLIASV
jgi:hypothetical protein